LREVVEQCRDIEACADGMTPAVVDGSCCVTCKPKPHCKKKCGDKKCTSGGCRKKSVKKLAIRVLKALADKAGTDEDNMKRLLNELILEAVNRFCDNRVDEAREKRCAGVAEKLEALVVKKVKKLIRKIKKRPDGRNDTITDGVDFEVEIETVDTDDSAAATTTAAFANTTTAAFANTTDTTNARRSLADDMDVFDAALLDVDATEGMIEEVQTDEEATTNTTKEEGAPAPEAPKGCTLWFDGCNKCMVGNGTMGCTKMACDKKKENPKCLESEGCTVWFDGCNTCKVEDGTITQMCTEKACDTMEKPKCHAYGGDATDTTKEGDATDTTKEGDATDTTKEGNATDTTKEGNATDTTKEGNATDTTKEGAKDSTLTASSASKAGFAFAFLFASFW
jgi:hypothetical protein